MLNEPFRPDLALDLPEGVVVRVLFGQSGPAQARLMDLWPAARIHKAESGKPWLETPGGGHHPASITHTAGLDALAWTVAGALGIDAEPWHRPVHPRLLDRIRHPREADAWCADPLRLWTAKEAVLKALGHGLRTPMRSILLEETGTHTARCRWNGHEFHLAFHDLPAHRLCVAHTHSFL